MENLQNKEITEETKEELNWCVYIHTCKINNKAYIGIAKGNPKRRWGKNGCRYLLKNKDGTYIHPALAQALNKYKDWNNDWEHIIFKDGLSESKAKYIEKILIALFKTNVCKYGFKYGYNCTDGGDGLSGKPCSEETKRKISESERGKLVSDETKQKLSTSLKGKYTGEAHPLWGVKISEESKKKNRDAHLGKKASEETKKKMSSTHKQRLADPKNHPNYGKHLSETHRKNIGKANKGRRISDKHKEILSEFRSIAVVQLTKDGQFICDYPSIKAAEQITGVPHHINECCRGKRKTCGGFIWMYKKEYEQQFKKK